MNEPGDSKNRQSTESKPRAPSPALLSQFSFVDSPIDFCNSKAIVVRIPRGIRSKEKLFAIYTNALRFPQYFGWNWDALEECLRDLSWLPPNRPIAIVHEELPFGPGGDNRGIYLDLLGSILRHWSQAGDRAVQVVMPTSMQMTLSQATNAPR